MRLRNFSALTFDWYDTLIDYERHIECVTESL